MSVVVTVTFVLPFPRPSLIRRQRTPARACDHRSHAMLVHPWTFEYVPDSVWSRCWVVIQCVEAPRRRSVGGARKGGCDHVSLSCVEPGETQSAPLVSSLVGAE